MVLGGYSSPFAFSGFQGTPGKMQSQNCWIIGCQQVILNLISKISFISCFSTSVEVRKSPLSAFIGIVIPLDRTASCSSSTKDEKHSWLGGKPMVVSAASGLVVAAGVSVPVSEGGAELGGSLGCGVAVILLAAEAAGQSVHSQSPRQNGSYEQVALSVARSLPLLGLFSVSRKDLYWGHGTALTRIYITYSTVAMGFMDKNYPSPRAIAQGQG